MKRIRTGQLKTIQVSAKEMGEVDEFVEQYRRLNGNISKHGALMVAVRAMKAKLDDEEE